MKKNLAVIAISVLLAGVMLAVVAAAANEQGRPYPEFGHRSHHGGNPLQMMSRYLYQNLMAQTLAEMTGQPVESMSQQLRDRRPRAVIEEHGIDRTAFRTAMQAKVNALIRQFAENGYITPEQEKNIAEKMERRAQRRALMTRLVAKGLEDGTITEEEARILTPKRR